MDVPEALVDYLASIRHLAKEDASRVPAKLTVFAEWCALQRVQLQQVNHRKVQEFLDWLKANHTSHKTGVNEISSRTISNYVRKIHSFLDWCLEDEEYSQFVKLQTIKGIKMPHVEQFVKEVFTDEEIESLLLSIL